jgi:hypothetical protein
MKGTGSKIDRHEIANPVRRLVGACGVAPVGLSTTGNASQVLVDTSQAGLPLFGLVSFRLRDGAWHLAKGSDGHSLGRTSSLDRGKRPDPDHRAGFTHRGDRQRAYAILRFPGEEA